MEGVDSFLLEITDDDIDEENEYIVFGVDPIAGVDVTPTLFLINDDDTSGVQLSLAGRPSRTRRVSV